MPARTVKINSRVGTLKASSTLAITARAKELKAEGHDVVNFAGGEPDFDTPQPIKDAAIAALSRGETKYTPSIGSLALREAIARKFKSDNHLDYTPAQIAVSCGAKHAIFNAVQVLADEGDDVLIPSPYWVSYPEMVKLAGATPHFLPTSPEQGFKITADQLREAVRETTRLLILNSPSNPTGAVYSRSELEALAEVCCEKDLMVISDEIYEKLLFTEEPYCSLAALSEAMAERTLTVKGVSKAYAMTGWRIGYVAGPEEIIGSIKKLQDHSTSNPCSLSQAAAIAALNLPPDAVQTMRDEFKARRDLLLKGLEAVPAIKPITPEGAFYLFCDISALGDSFTVAQKILNDAKVAFIPGEGFGAPGFARLSFATSRERIQEGVRRIAEWIRSSAS